MTATDRCAAPSGAPPSALRLWADSKWIYAEIPGPTPYIMKFSLSESGLSKALSLIRERKLDFGSTPLLHSSYKATIGTPLQRAVAEKFLRERGIVK